MTWLKSGRGNGSLVARLLVVFGVLAGGIVGTPGRSNAVDYRLAILGGSFTIQVGERLIMTVAPPSNVEVEALLTDPATTALVQVSEPIVTRTSIVDIVGGGEFAAEDEASLRGPVFQVANVNDQPAYQLNLATGRTARGNALPLDGEGLRAVRLTLTGPTGLVAQTTTFLNVVSNRTYSPLAVYFIADVDGPPTLQPDGSTVLGANEQERLRDLRDLLSRKPPGVPISVRIRPDLVDGLARSAVESDREVLADLLARLPENDVLVGTFRPTDVASYAATGLKSQFEAQLLRGETVADSVNGPNLTTRAIWLTDDPLDSSGVDLLRGFGVTNIVAFGDAADAFGADVDPSRPYAVRTEKNGLVLALADRRYSTLLDRPTGTAYQSAVAIAAEVLAQRAELIDSPVGSVALISRQVVLVAASGTPPEPLIPSILLRLLRRSPQIDLRQTTEMAPTLDGLSRIDPPDVPIIDVGSISARTTDALIAVESVRDMLVTNEGLVDRWIEVVDVANDTSINDARRDEYLSTVLANVDAARNAVRLPTASFTFGSRESDLRISLANTSPYAVSLRLRLASPTGKMVFVPPFVDVVLPAGGQDELVITAQARANGLIPVELVLASPSGTIIDTAGVRVRVNALAGLGRGVSGMFLGLLAVWWIVYSRRAARKRKAHEHPALRSQS